MNPIKYLLPAFSKDFMKIFQQSVWMIPVRRKSQVKGGINFELKAENIIHAPVGSPKHF